MDKERFLKKIERCPKTGCWIWVGAKFSGKDRGQFWFRGTNWLAARAGWTIFRGELPDGKMLCHTCDRSLCVNPEHLYIGDQATNMWDRKVRERTSRWDKRYNFRQTPELEKQVKDMRAAGMEVKAICAALKIGRSTYFRMLRRGIVDDATNAAASHANRSAAAYARK